MTPPSEEFKEVRIVGLPLDIYRETSEHFDDLKREFALMRSKEPGESVPDRLVTVSEELTTRYGGFTSAPNQTRDEALERGDPSVDLSYEVPVDVKEACIVLEALLEEADDFCRAGEHLLTLATPPRAVEFRRWFLREFVRQIDGEAPTSWAEHNAGAGN